MWGAARGLLARRVGGAAARAAESAYSSFAAASVRGICRMHGGAPKPSASSGGGSGARAKLPVGAAPAGSSKTGRRMFSDWRARGDLQPAPRHLSEIVKLPLMKREDSVTVSE